MQTLYETSLLSVKQGCYQVQQNPFKDAVTLLSLRPPSLMYKNPQRRKTIHEMRPVRRKER